MFTTVKNNSVKIKPPKKCNKCNYAYTESGVKICSRYDAIIDELPASQVNKCKKYIHR